VKVLLIMALVQVAPGGAGLLSPSPPLDSEPAVLDLASRLIEAQLPLTAGDILTRYLSSRRDPAPPDPPLVLLAAGAYARAGAWPEVLRLLRGQPWLDRAEMGRGLLELARAYTGADSLKAALAAYRRYLDAASSEAWEPMPDVSGIFRVGYASVLSRLGRHDDAAAQYEAVAEALPDVAGWFRLSALQELALAGDAEGASRMAAALGRDPVVPADSVRRELVLAAFGSGALQEGLTQARRLPTRTSAALAAEWIAPALLATGDSTAAQRALKEALERRVGRRAGELLLELAPGWETKRSVAESDRRAGRADRAARLLRLALEEAPGEEKAAIRMELAEAQFAARDNQGVVWTLAPWLEGMPAGPGVAAIDEASVWFLAGRAFSRLDAREAAEDAFRRSAEAGFGTESAFAAYLLADHLQDDGRLEASRAAYEGAISRFPRSGWAARSLIRLGMLSFVLEEYDEAYLRFRTYRKRYPGGNWYHATIYWTGRSLEASGDTASARALYREALGYSPLSYYGHLAARRIGEDAFDMATRRGGPRLPELSSEAVDLLGRMETLRALGWEDRAGWEFDVALGAGTVPRGQLLPLARALSERGWARRGIRLGLRARRREGGRWSEATLRAVYPLPYRTAIEELARLRGLDVALVAGLIRRESLFEADVVSSAGAVGLMQLLPRTALEMSREAGVAGFTGPQLEVPEVNLRLGTLYLERMLDRFDGSVIAALISYNAGPHRYLRWREFPELEADPELFVERIPFRETRVYAKEVTANALIYARLYGLADGHVDGVERGR